MQHEPADVAHQLAEAAERDGGEEGPCLPPGADDELGKEEEPEEGGEEGVHAGDGAVAVEGGGDGTGGRDVRALG